MRLSTSTNIYFNRPDGTKADIRDSIALCAQAGYRVMDMNFHDCTTFRNAFVGRHWRQWVEEIRAAAQVHGIEFSQGHAPFYNFCDPGYDKREWHDRMICRAVDCARILGIPWLVIHAGTDFSAADSFASSKRLNREYLLPLLEYAERQGVGIAVENLWDLNIAPLKRYTASAEELVDLVDSLDAPNVGICFDVEHATIMKQDVPAQLRLIGGRLKATHVSDVINTDSDHMLPFAGRTDWPPFLTALREIGYQGDFTYEIHRYTASLPDALVPSALAYSVEVGQYLLSLGQGDGQEKKPQ